MNNNLKTYKEVTLNGKEHLLKFDYNAVCDLEEIYNKGIAGILKEEQIGFRLVKTFYWAGLKWKNPGLTLDRVGNMLGKEIQDNGKNVMDLMGPVMEALKKSRLLGANKNTDDGFEDETDQDGNEQEENENPNE
jgi:hypothetical protein